MSINLLPFIIVVGICISIMVILTLDLCYQLYCSPLIKSNRLQNTNKYQYLPLLQGITAFTCIIAAIGCSIIDLYKFILCSIYNKNIFWKSIFNPISDGLLFISCVLLYIRLIYFRLHLPFSNSCYAYSKSSLFIVSIPIFICISCQVMYIIRLSQYLSPTKVNKQDSNIQPWLIAIMILDLFMNVITLFLFVQKLIRLILDTPYDDFIEHRKGSLMSNDSKQSIISINTVQIVNKKKVSFSNTRIENKVAIITRYCTVCIVGIVANQSYWIMLALWTFVFKDSSLMGYITFTVRAINNMIAVCVQYLLFYKYSKKLYNILCINCDRICFKYWMKKLRIDYMEHVNTLINSQKNQNSVNK
eukprot:306872_1